MFSKNCDRLLAGEIAARLLEAVPAPPEVKRLLSSEHFSVEGTLIEAWASPKSFKPKASRGAASRRRRRCGGRPQRPGGLQGAEALERDARLDYRPGRASVPQEARMEARLCYIGPGLMEPRSGLIVDTG